MMAPNGLGLFGAFMVLAGALAPPIGIFFWNSVRKQLGWVPVRGVICVSEVRWDGEDYRAHVEYTYSYREREFRSTRVRSLRAVANWRGPAQRVARKYPPGTEITVFIDPENPRESVLEPGVSRMFLPTLLIVSAVVLVLGLRALGAFR